MEAALLFEMEQSEEYLVENYDKRHSWYKEYTGPAVLHDDVTGEAIGYHPTWKVYIYQEFLSKYDLNVFVGALVKEENPSWVYVQGSQKKDC
jgi:hypothetical protein